MDIKKCIKKTGIDPEVPFWTFYQKMKENQKKIRFLLSWKAKSRKFSSLFGIDDNQVIERV